MKKVIYNLCTAAMICVAIMLSACSNDTPVDPAEFENPDGWLTLNGDRFYYTNSEDEGLPGNFALSCQYIVDSDSTYILAYLTENPRNNGHKKYTSGRHYTFCFKIKGDITKMSLESNLTSDMINYWAEEKTDGLGSIFLLSWPDLTLRKGSVRLKWVGENTFTLQFKNYTLYAVGASSEGKPSSKKININGCMNVISIWNNVGISQEEVSKTVDFFRLK